MAQLQRRSDETLTQYYERLREKSDREDLVMFINACFASTRQNEFYNDRYRQSVSIDFLHHYILANYRQVYARALATGINHFNQAAIILNLLQAGAPSDPDQKTEEGLLIRGALRGLPANRAYSLLKNIKHRRINNRRSRAVIKSYLNWRREPEFDAIKYQNKFRSAVVHAHLGLKPELANFLFDFESQKQFDNKLLDNYRQAHYSAAAIYELPFTIAESLSQKHGISKDVFFAKIEPKMTAAEKLRYQSSIAKTKGAGLDFDLSRSPLTKLVLYILSRPAQERTDRAEEFDAALTTAAKRCCARSPLQLGRVAAILDHSRSSRGSRQKRNRPLAVAIGVDYLLRQTATEYRSFWTPISEETSFEFLREPCGQTSLADKLLDALDWKPDQILIVSDGYENDPPLAVDQVAEVYRKRIGKESTPEIIHVNPVFDADHFAPRPLGKSIATIGLRDAQDLATMLGFARFASGKASLDDLQQYLSHRSKLMLSQAATTETTSTPRVFSDDN